MFFLSLFFFLLPLPSSLSDDTPETIGNNASYLRAVENGRDREIPLRRTTLHDTSSNNKSSSSRLIKTMRTSSMKVTPLQPTATTTGEESNRYENLIIIMYMYSYMSLYMYIM